MNKNTKYLKSIRKPGKVSIHAECMYGCKLCCG